MPKIAIIQREGLRRPVVFGIGRNERAAWLDAATFAETFPDGLHAYPCSDALVEQVDGGNTECAIVDGRAVALAEQ